MQIFGLEMKGSPGWRGQGSLMERRAEPRRPHAWETGDGQLPLRGFSTHIHLTPGLEALGVSIHTPPFITHSHFKFFSTKFFKTLSPTFTSVFAFFKLETMVGCFQKLASQNNYNNRSNPPHQRCLYINKTKQNKK